MKGRVNPQSSRTLNPVGEGLLPKSRFQEHVFLAKLGSETLRSNQCIQEKRTGHLTLSPGYGKHMDIY